MTGSRVYSHVDLRVHDLGAAVKYYDQLLGALGMTGSYANEWMSYQFAEQPEAEAEWLAFTEDKSATPGSACVAFHAQSRSDVDRIASLLPSFGSRAIEGPEFAYGPKYYAVFFEDPDGNKLEICHIGE